MKKAKYDYETLIKRALILAFKIDKELNISIRPKGYGQPLSGMMLDVMRQDDYKRLQKILFEYKLIEPDIKSYIKPATTPSQMDFWYEVLTDWFTPLDEKESLILRMWAKKIPMKTIASVYEKKFGIYYSRKTILTKAKNAVDKIKCYLWQKSL